MRKALMFVLLAATAATPVAASAQSVDGRAQIRAERQAQRAERQQQRERAATVRTEARVRTPAASWPGQVERTERILNQRARIEAGQERREDRVERREDRRENRVERREDRRDFRRDVREDRREWRQDRREDRIERRQWNRGWRNDNRYDWLRYRNHNRSIFNIGRYYAPYGNSYSRFSIGLRLGSPYYSSRYWIADPWQYRLPPAYAGTRWVRYYDDVLLVDLYTGEVMDVIHNFFW